MRPEHLKSPRQSALLPIAVPTAVIVISIVDRASLGIALESPFRTRVLDLLIRVPPERLKQVKYWRKGPEEAEAFFWSKVEVGQPGECWLWTGSTTPVGNRAGDEYGLTNINGRACLAHRHAYTIAKGAIPKGLVVRHTCDVFLCCNPSHLIVGTPAQNTQDAVDRGRIPRGDDSSARRHPESRPRGETSPKASVTTLEVHLMRWLYSWGWASPPLLARIFKLSTVQVNNVVAGQSWRHVDSFVDMSPGKKQELDRLYAQDALKRRPGRKIEDQKVIREMRLRWELGWSYARLAKFYGLSPSHVSRTVRGETWSHVS